MSIYNSLVLHNDLLILITNSSDMTYNNTFTLSLATDNSLFLKLSGGTLRGNLTVNSLTDTSQTDNAHYYNR